MPQYQTICCWITQVHTCVCVIGLNKWTPFFKIFAEMPRSHTHTHTQIYIYIYIHQYVRSSQQLFMLLIQQHLSFVCKFADEFVRNNLLTVLVCWCLSLSTFLPVTTKYTSMDEDTSLWGWCMSVNEFACWHDTHIRRVPSLFTGIWISIHWVDGCVTIRSREAPKHRSREFQI